MFLAAHPEEVVKLVFLVVVSANLDTVMDGEDASLHNSTEFKTYKGRQS